MQQSWNLSGSCIISSYHKRCSSSLSLIPCIRPTPFVGPIAVNPASGSSLPSRTSLRRRTAQKERARRSQRRCSHQLHTFLPPHPHAHAAADKPPPLALQPPAHPSSSLSGSSRRRSALRRMAASVRDGAAAAGHVADDHDGGLSDGEMDMDVDAGSEFHDGADRRDGGAGAGAGEDDDEDSLLTRITDTSAAEARAGKDIQGIPWERLQITRQDYRKARLEQYKNYENFPQSGELMDKLCKQVEKSSKYYDFQHNTRLVRPSILHFQLRNLLWATSKHDVYYMSNSKVGHWSSISHKTSDVIDFSGHVAPAQKHPGSLVEGFTGVQVSTLAVNEDLFVAGGFQGELVCKGLGDRDVKFCTRTTLSDNPITNAIDIHRSTSGSLHITVSNNDCGVREFDMERFQLLNHFHYNWPVNHTSVSPDRKLLAIVGDDRDALLVDSQNGKVASTLVGHLDYSFATAWHPDGFTFATGNQDKTCRVWDIRNPSTSLAVLRGNIGAIRCIRYSSDGRFLLFSEPADFVHVYSAAAGYRKRQEIDFFGEISGISLSPDNESLFVGVCDRVYASLLQYRMVHNFGYLDSYM